ncbi:class I SAM-dependent methyltransferase [Phaeovulum vinaykumarii]|uniref:SAM-dependent methyltransferase, MidA family n=1 Tax=Phaeovulum vinaykumarii TaxID=407234 RepID=A0A1N7MF91_9RHOB|nr:SAM-dependent methyltransferase [Phaeovulum vinaykumarii]SIS84670.1 SAM-dependent methyltransferase, MidA family [Phaeovulum vinaykumarii]SOC11886.1 SAM-dependent MidA family methyltransferase [Phaeovulum vinaykumarii]
MSPLAGRLAARIRAEGPMRIDMFMAACLLDPEHGYYTRAEPFGRAGDFITAPEISQMFGEMLGVWLAQMWQAAGAPAPFVLAELGPGRGTLMADILRVARQVPGMAAAARVHLLEASPRLRALQGERVPGAIWHDSLETLPEGPLFVVANEFLDALPIRQFQRTDTGWAERLVGLAPAAAGAGCHRLAFGLAPPRAVPELDGKRAHTRPGDWVETCPAAVPIVQTIARRIADGGGAALFIDYGGWDGVGDTLQALRAHAPQDVLAEPGCADLTAHVDFAPLARAARAAGVAVAGPETQGAFLERLGITARAQALAGKLSGDALAAHVAAHRRLVHPQEMGHLFKVLALHPAGTPLPPGLSAPAPR